MRFDARDIGLAFNQPELIDYTPTSTWERGPATDRQKEALRKAGIRTGRGMTKGEASKILDYMATRRQEALCTIKQAAALIGFGHTDAALVGFEEASNRLDTLFAANPRPER